MWNCNSKDFFEHPYEETLAWSNNVIGKTKESSKRTGILTLQKEKFTLLFLVGQARNRYTKHMGAILLPAFGVPTRTC